MATNPEFDPDRILRVLDLHGLEYVLVGGLAARVHGAQRTTADIDCVPAITPESHPRTTSARMSRSHGQVRTLFAM